MTIVCALWAGLFFLARSNEAFRQKLPVPVLILLGSDDGVRGGEWDEPAPQEKDHRPTHQHIIDVFSSDEAPGRTGDEDGAESAEGQESAESEPEGPQVFEENPRYTVEQDAERGEILRSEVLKGDSAGKILGAWLNANDSAALLAAAKPVYTLTNIRIGHAFSITRDPKNGDFRSFRYEVDGERFLVVDRTETGFAARIDKIDYTTQLVHLQGTISTNLSEAVVGLGENVGLAISMADIFGSEINFITDLRVGDSFDVLVEKRSHNGVFKGYGRMIGARFTNKGKAHQAYMFLNENGRTAYYNNKGESMRRTLLKAPLSFLRVTSRYNMARKHPVFGVVRPHQGIDYGAPHGTPIMAVGDGTVAAAGRAGGYGNQVVLRHSGGLESLYGHMSGFAKGIRSGVWVRQGQTIGYVGATGTATGPHLDFRIKQRGKFVNPDKLVVPRDPGVDRRSMKRFKAVIAAVDAYWDGKKDPASYDPDVWFEENPS